MIQTTSPAGSGKAPRRPRRRPLIALAAAAIGLLALAAPVAAQASVQPQPVAVRPAQPGPIGDVSSNGHKYYIGNCTLVVGDHWEANRYASGEADVKCPATYTYHVHVYLDYAWNGRWQTATSYAANVYWPYPNRYLDVWTRGVCSTSGQPETLYWVTAVSISFNSGPVYRWYYSVPNWYQIPGC
jgi:hypothetical protein